MDPGTNFYAKLLEQNLEEKAAVLKPLKLDIQKMVAGDFGQQPGASCNAKEKKARVRQQPRYEGKSSPYQMRARKVVTMEDGTLVRTAFLPLRRISPRVAKQRQERDSMEDDGSLLDQTVVPVAKDEDPRKTGSLRMQDVVQEVDSEDWDHRLVSIGRYMGHRRAELGEWKAGEKGKGWTSAIDEFRTTRRLWGEWEGGWPVKSTWDLDRFKEKVSKLSIWCGGLARVLRERVASLAVHPSKERLIIAVGGKKGAMGLWIVSPAFGSENGVHKEDESHKSATGVYRFEPHSGQINCTSFCAFGGDKIFTTSYDGTVRVVDLEKLVFDELFSTPEDDKRHWMQWHCQLSPHVLLVSQGTGNVYVVDDRSHLDYEAILRCYERSCRTVSIHPLHSVYLATSSSLGYVSIWDLRKLGHKGSKKSNGGQVALKGVVSSGAAICHLCASRKTVLSAFFSPVTGSGLLATSSDDYIRIYDTSRVVEGVSSTPALCHVETGIRHCNKTGMWLTPFRATWHPQRDDAFVVGSMAQPRQVEIFGRHGRMLTALGKDGHFPINTVCPVNAFHPSRLLLASADSGGRVHLLL